MYLIKIMDFKPGVKPTGKEYWNTWKME